MTAFELKALELSDPARIVADYERDGVVRIAGFLGADEVAEIRTELDRYVREDLPGLPLDARTLEPDGETVRNLWRLEKHNSFFGQMGQRDHVLALISQLVHGEPLLTGVETFNKPARVGSGVPPHQDNAYFCQRPPDMLTVWIAIDPVTRENGAVRYLPGTHRSGLRPSKPSGVTGNSVGLADSSSIADETQLIATLEPGDATIHHCEVVHYSDPNRTEYPRLGLLFVYRGTHTTTDPELKRAYTAAVTQTPPA